MKIYLAVFLLMILVVVGYALFDSPHEFSMDECKRCHAKMPQPGQKSLIDPQQKKMHCLCCHTKMPQTGEKSPFTMVKRIKTLCSSDYCHKKIVRRYSHPDDIIPENVHVPADMPLSVNGKITCATCHDIHSTTEWSKKVHLLRRPVEGAEFCSTCHEESPGAISHKEMLGYAHSAGSKYIPLSRSGTIDSLSIQCISCHDNSISKADTIAGVGYWMHSEELVQNLGGHPIGADYEESRMKDPNGFRPKTSLLPVRLFSGKVGCGSCHDPYSMRRAKLVMDNEGSKLCLRCHNK